MNKFSKFTKYLQNKVTSLKNKAEHTLETIRETNGLPKSKRKSALLGMATVFSIFGITMLGSSLPAIAEDLPVPGSPTPSPKPSEELTKALAGAAASVCGLAVTSGSFLVGAACGIVVVYGILRIERK